MRPLLATCLAAGALACAGASRTGPSSPVVQITATVEHTDVEGGAWLLRATNDTLYRPTELPEPFRVPGARVVATVRERRDLTGVPLPGVVCDVLEIEPASCAGVRCPAPEPPLTLRVRDAATGAPTQEVALANVRIATAAAGEIPTTWGCSAGPDVTTCTVNGDSPGLYELEVVAPGHQPSHVRVEVAAGKHVPGVCCEQAWIARTVDVAMVK